MQGPEFREPPEVSPEGRFPQRVFGLVKVDFLHDRGFPGVNYISEFDGWAVETESFLDRWLEFSPVKLLHERFQLGLNRSFPLPNNHTRFEHSAEVALRSVLVLIRLAHESRGEFLALSQDYPLNLNPDLSGEQRENEQVLKTIKLGAIYATIHDIATPAGGDAVKYIFDLDDDRDLPEVLKWNFAEFSRLCQEDGFDPEKTLALFTKLAKRQDKGILGQLIHRFGGKDRGFDLDSICYTLMDAQVCLGLSWDLSDSSLRDEKVVKAAKEVIESRIQRGELPPEFLPVFLEHWRQGAFAIRQELERATIFLKEQQRRLNRGARVWVESHQGEFWDLYRHDLPYPFVSLSHLSPQRPQLSLRLKDFSPFSSVALKNGKVVFTDPQKIDNLFLLTNFLAEHIYFSPSGLGPEIGLAARTYWERGFSFSSQEKHYLLTTGDYKFLEFLKENSPNFAYWFSDLGALRWEGENLARGDSPKIYLDGETPEFIEAFKHLPALLRIRKMPTRLNTPVLISGEVSDYGKAFTQRRKESNKAARRQGILMERLPYWSRPRIVLHGDECNPLERHILERQPYW